MLDTLTVQHVGLGCLSRAVASRRRASLLAAFAFTWCEAGWLFRPPMGRTTLLHPTIARRAARVDAVKADPRMTVSVLSRYRAE